MKPALRAMILLTLPAAGVGAIAGLFLRTTSPPAPAEPAPAAEPPGEHRAPRVRREPQRPRVRAEPGGASTSLGPGAPDRLDPLFAERLSSPDANVRYACALHLLQLGPDRTDAVDHLATTTEDGNRLRDAIVNALTTLGRIEAGESWATMPEEGRQEVRLRYFLQVVPESMLRAERKRFWEARVAGDSRRLERGAITEGEAAWHRLELCRIRHELGEISSEEWRALREASIAPAREWVGSLDGAPGVSQERVREMQAALVRIDATE